LVIQYLRRPPSTGLVYRNELGAGRRQALPPKFLRRTRRVRGACDLEREIPNRESIMASRSFGRLVTALAELREAVTAASSSSSTAPPCFCSFFAA
jgi:hypothetical protein